MRVRRLLQCPLLVVLAVCCTGLSARELPSGFRLEPVVGGLTEPAALTFTPDARILIAERTTGNLRVVRGGVLQAAPLCSVSVASTGEGGLLGIAVHPQFNRSGWVYLYYTDLSSGVNKVTRFTLGSDSCTDPLTILANLGSGGTLLRNGGGLAFGSDGKLYVATGDVQVQGNAQDGSNLRGKILRVNDDGTIPSDNPTAGSLVYSVGVRDGRAVAAGPSVQIYASDRGDNASSVEDEVNKVPAGGNLGWPIETGAGGGLHQPLEDWLPTIGVHGLAFGAAAFPDRRSDGIDNDHDRFGPDRYPGKARFDDNNAGICVGGEHNTEPCLIHSDCHPQRSNETYYCEFRDEPAEYCPGGTANYDDVCGNTGAAGTDEPDEGYVQNLFAAASGEIERLVLTGAGLDQLASWGTFLDSTPSNPAPPPPAIVDCPTGWTGAAVSRDGWLYLLARNSGGNSGHLYRVIGDLTAGPREVSAPGSAFPLRVEKGGSAGEVVLFWEDLRDDAMQPRDNGTNPLPPQREYTVWKGTIGSYYSHNPIAGLAAEPGIAVNAALRTKNVPVDTAASEYFFVSARHDNLNGTLGRNSANVERPGYAVTDLCPSIGYYGTPVEPGTQLFLCGQNFSLRDEHGQLRSFYEFRGRPVLIDISAIWCIPCHGQANIMQNLYEDYKDRGVAMLTVLNDDQVDTGSTSPADRPSPMECLNWTDRPDASPDHTFDCWVDPGPWISGQTWYKYFNEGWPTNVLLDQGMRVIYDGLGYSETTIRSKLDALLGTTDSCLH